MLWVTPFLLKKTEIELNFENKSSQENQNHRKTCLIVELRKHNTNYRNSKTRLYIENCFKSPHKYSRSVWDAFMSKIDIKHQLLFEDHTG